MDEERYNSLPNHLKFAVIVTKMLRDGEIPYFKVVAERSGLSRNEANSAEHRLIDVGAIRDDNWTKVGSSWVRAYKIGGLETEFFSLLCDGVYGEVR